jgi:hypothetical protein
MSKGARERFEAWCANRRPQSAAAPPGVR